MWFVTKTPIRLIANLILALMLVLLLAVQASAQSKFSPEIKVGDSIITRYQIDQRTQFLTLLRAPGNVRELAKEQLINEQIQLAAARELGTAPDQAAIDAGLAEFASRGDLTTEEFLTLLGQAGVSPGTFRDFITAGVAWRDTVRARFGEELREEISPAQIRRALAQFGTEGGLRVLVSEVLLPANTPENREASLGRAAEISQLSSESAFSAAARQFSIGPSAANGGALNWVALESLPAEVRGVISALSPGQISRPVTLENAIGVFLLRDLERVAEGAPDRLSVDYALFLVDGTAADATRLIGEVDTCDDLNGLAKGLPENRLIRETKQLDDVPGDIRNALARLDNNEADTSITRDGQPTILMLCERRAALESTVDDDIVANRILNSRLQTSASHYLSTLRANTIVTDLSN